MTIKKVSEEAAKDFEVECNNCNSTKVCFIVKNVDSSLESSELLYNGPYCKKCLVKVAEKVTEWNRVLMCVTTA